MDQLLVLSRSFLQFAQELDFDIAVEAVVLVELSIIVFEEEVLLLPLILVISLVI